MLRTLNYTGRRKVETKELQIFLETDDQGRHTFDVNFSLDQSRTPENGVIYIEAYQRNTLQRFQFGTVGQIQKPDNRILNQIDQSGPPLFRIHIVDESEHLGRLIASTTGLRPEGEDENDQRASLITVKSRPLQEEVWNIEFDTGGKPELCINNRIPNAIGQIKDNPLFQALILPAVLRHVLMYYLWDDDFEEGNIAEKWLHFATHIGGERPETDDSATHMKWIDTVVERFSKSFKLCEMLVLKMEEG